MRGLGKSCLRWLLFYAGTGVALSLLAFQRIPDTRIALICGFIAAVPLWLFLGCCYGVAQRHGEMRMVRQSMSPDPPRDNRRVAVSGTVRGSHLESPLTKRRCVVYEYKIFPGVESPVGILEGFSMSNVAIDGPRGSVRLLAMPELAFPAQTLRGAEARANFDEYAGRTQFTRRTGFDLSAELSHQQSLFDDNDGTIRYDVRRDVTGMPIHEMTYQEKTLEQGDRVIAMGRYDASRHGLVPDPKALLHPVKIMKGDPAAIVRRLAKKDLKDIPVTLFFLLLFAGGVLIALAAMPLSEIERIYPAKVPSEYELRIEQWLDENIRK
jgi:hypothetical protein